MKWIKASERLPEDKLDVVFRTEKRTYVGFYNADRKEFYSDVAHRNGYLQVELSEIEWLDESPSTEVKGQQEALYKIADLKRESLDLGESWYDRLTTAVSIAKEALASQPQEVGQDELWEQLVETISYSLGEELLSQTDVDKCKTLFTLIKK